MFAQVSEWFAQVYWRLCFKIAATKASTIASTSACERVAIRGMKKEDASYVVVDDPEDADVEAGADDAGVGAREIVDNEER